MNVDEMKAGTELDAAVAREIFGLVVERRGERYRYYNNTLAEDYGGRWTTPVPAYSTEVSAAFEVVDRMRSLGWRYEVGDTYDGEHSAMFMRGDYDRYNDEWDEEYGEAGETPALAICLAALKTVSSVGEANPKQPI